ncbi:MAG: diguanylate cyclase [Candidatus Aminicenantes bacterium]|nr:diguanylate cyclase [Candidatus Aminicenantes bacterium]
MKVLIAEDNIILSRSLARNISNWGYDVVTARNGLEAWNTILEENIRLAILDWMMPGIDGLSLCRKIRTELPKNKSEYVYIILLTGKNQQEDIIEGLSAGADDYMIKPANLLELKVRLTNGSRIINLEDKRIQLATTDSLTNVWNRGKIFEFFEDELDRGAREHVSIGAIMIDIDNFKQINDNFGHSVGDKVISEVAYRLKHSLRRYDKIGRYGGDELLIVLPNCDQNNVAVISERLREVICNKKIKTTAGNLDVSISLGGTSAQKFDEFSLNKMLESSDKALYRAKRNGRNCVVVTEPKKIIL